MHDHGLFAETKEVAFVGRWPLVEVRLYKSNKNPTCS